MVKTDFFDYLDFALQFAPAGPEEKEIRAKLARIGIGAGKTFDFKDLSPEQQAAVGSGMKDGEEKVEAAIARHRQEHQRLDRSVRSSAIAPSSTATG